MAKKKIIRYYPSRVRAEAAKFGRAYVEKKYGTTVAKKVLGSSKKTSTKSSHSYSKKHDYSKVQIGSIDRDANQQFVTNEYGEKMRFGKEGFQGWDIEEKFKGNISEKEIYEAARHFGTEYVKAKYGEDAYNKYKSKISKFPAFVKSKLTGWDVKNKRNPGISAFNKAPEARDGWEGPGTRSLFAAGGELNPANENAAFKRQMNFNLSNDEDLAQGSHHKWATPSSISHLISSQLRLASNQPADAWEAMGATLNEGTSKFNPEVQLAQSNPMGAFGTPSVMYDLGEEPEMMEEDMAEEGFGAFGGWFENSYAYNSAGQTYNLGMDLEAYREKYGGVRLTLSDKDKADWMRLDPQGFKAAMAAAQKAEYDRINEFNKQFPNSNNVLKDAGAIDVYNKTLKAQYAAFYNKQVGAEKMAPDGTWIKDPDAPNGPGTEDGGGYKNPPLPMYDTTERGTPYDEDVFGPLPDVYNPWSRLGGGNQNAYGPSTATMNQASIEAMALANAYFSPQRAELAYQLGDMETDMRRMAVNLGRQVDDPVLQAKLYKDAMKAVRTLDIQQSTFAFQMVDARRKEELANFQFYDQLAQNEAQLRVANRQFYDNLDLARSQYNLQNWIAMNQATMDLPTGDQTPSSGSGGTTQASEDYNWGTAKSVTPTVTSKGIYGKRYY